MPSRPEEEEEKGGEGGGRGGGGREGRKEEREKKERKKDRQTDSDCQRRLNRHCIGIWVGETKENEISVNYMNSFLPQLLTLSFPIC